MQSTISHAPKTVQERGIEATRRLREILGLDDLKLLATALAEIAGDEASRNPEFALRIREAYDQLASLKASSRSRTTGTKKPSVKLVPIAGAGDVTIDPHAPLDPYVLMKLYGQEQLGASLNGYSLAKLKEASATVEQRNPRTKPKSRASKAAIIDYIVEHVAGTSS